MAAKEVAQQYVRTAARLGLAIFVCLGFSACEKREPPPPNFKLLAADIHVSIAQHHLVLPFAALEDYRRNQQSFSLNGKSDAEREPMQWPISCTNPGIRNARSRSTGLPS